MSQHAELTPERWARFDRGEQLLQVAVEMFRASRWVELGRIELARAAYERVLRLVDLTIEAQTASTWRRELLRWRDLVADLYVSNAPDPAAHRATLRVLLQLHPATAAQIATLT